MNLHALVMTFCEEWAPPLSDSSRYHRFVDDLRELLEAYGEGALQHQSLPDTEHGHGGPR